MRIQCNGGPMVIAIMKDSVKLIDFNAHSVQWWPNGDSKMKVLS